MNFLSAENLSKRYGTKVLFENISFGIDEGQKVGLVARNGTGKSSLLKILMGHDSPDTGLVATNNSISLGMLEQQPEFYPGQTIEAYVLDPDQPIVKLMKRYESVMENYAADPSDKQQKELEKVTEEMDHLNAWEFEQRTKQILSQLDIHDLTEKGDNLSGGQQKRVALAKVLVEQPDLLILDEPTNHLDLDMIEWLEQYLSRSKQALLLVTHDRYFLDRVCTDILELEGGILYRHQGDYATYLQNKAIRDENAQVTAGKAKNLLKKELEWARRMPKARGTKSKYRMEGVDKLKEVANSFNKEENLEMQVKMTRLGNKILELYYLEKSYGDKKILDGFSHIFKKGERVGIVGKNGAGKSTLLRIVTGKEKPDAGSVVKGETIQFGYYSQDGMPLTEDLRVIEVLQEIAEVFPLADGSKMSAAQMLYRFQFPNDQHYSYVSTLSGGERRRLYLLTVLMENPNFLILDEPTNDLDLMTINALEDFLESYPGCLLIVSHDRSFLDKLADHLFVFEGNGKVKDFNGTYTDYRSSVEQQKAEELEAKKAGKEKKSKADPAQKEKVKPLSKLSFKEKKEMEDLEKAMEKVTASQTALAQKMNSGEVTDHKELQALSKDFSKLETEIDEMEMRWLELSEKEG